MMREKTMRNPEGTVLREESVDDEVTEPVAESTPETTNDSPSGDSEVKSEEVIAPAEEEVAPPTDPQDFSDILMKEWQADPVKKTILDRMIEKEAKRRKDEFAGAELGWIEKEKRKDYKEHPEKWKSDLEKLQDYDRLRGELEKLKTQPTVSADPSAKAPVPVDDADAIAKAFVAEQNIQDEQIPVISALIRLIEERTQKRVEKSVPQAIDSRQWEADTNWAMSQDDYKSNRHLRALAHDYNRVDGMSPKEALLQARKDLKIAAPKTTITQGKPAVGKPAFSRDSASAVGESDADEYDGKDPMIALKKKLASKGL